MCVARGWGDGRSRLAEPELIKDKQRLMAFGFVESWYMYEI